jgi:putative DNA primase/helicase
MTAAEIAHHLRGRKSGSGWLACCPAHDDKNPSLSLRDADDKVLVYCHAGCKQSAVIEALIARGLWPEQELRQTRSIVAEYDYTDEGGHLLYQVVRTDPKGFFQRRPDGHGGWINKKGRRQVLYRLREVLESPIVFVCEGEKDVETLREHGFVATTNAGGAEAPWLAGFTEALRGCEVILLPDRDRPGRERVARIARALVGNVARLTILELEGAKDITEWFQKGHSECELIAQLEDSEVSR